MCKYGGPEDVITAGAEGMCKYGGQRMRLL